MNKILLASHGPLAKAMKETSEFLLGESEILYDMCAYVDENSKDLQKMIDKWQEEKREEDTWLVITDLFGGSVNNEFMNRAATDSFYLVSGMNLPLILAVLTQSGDLTEESVRQAVSGAGEALMYCTDMREQDEEDEDF